MKSSFHNIYDGMGLSQKKIVPTLLKVSVFFFEVETPGFPVNFIMTTLEFSTFLRRTLWKSLFFPQILTYPLGNPTTLLSLYTLEIFIDILNSWVSNFFRKSPIHSYYHYICSRILGLWTK